MEITPLDKTVTIEEKPDPKDRADVWPGQEATVRIMAFQNAPYSRLSARVLEICPDAIQDERGTPYLGVRIGADAARLTSKFSVTPGMTANVDIKSGRRTILEYLTRPIETVADAALKE